ncbi:MAG: hypothetical protein RMK52_08260 [Chitinophagales bacterium]|nr:hypothetical protein [Chitinophagales bacterium]MDW8394220.1 hypothetical protein [Chitinophagales bacterium]
MADRRLTLNRNSGFYTLLKECLAAREQVRLLYDEQGIRRAEGYLLSLEEPGPDCMLVLDNGKRIPVAAVVAVNGLFADDYSEC